MSRDLYLVQSIGRRTKSTAAEFTKLYQQSYVTDDPRGKRLQVALRATALGMNGTMIAGVPPPVEGDDAPIWRRDAGGREGANYRRQAELQALLAAYNPLPTTNITLLLTPPLDEGDTPFHRRYYTASEGTSYRAEHAARRARWGAGEKTAWGVFPPRLPATSYDINLCALLVEIRRHMLEPDLSPSADFQLWTRSEVLSYLNNRISRFLLETNLVTTLTTIDDDDGVYPDDTIQVLRVAWEGADGTRASLQRIDRWQADMGLGSWESSTGTPYAIVEQPKPSLEYRLVPPPDQEGELHLVYVADPDEMATCADTLPIPGMFAWAIKWGTIADMLYKQGEANDPVRAKVAEKRWQLGVELAKLMVAGSK